jgi:hypothetical protein
MMELAEISALADKIAEIRSKLDKLESETSLLNKEKYEAEVELISSLEASGLDSFKGSQGNYSVINRMSVKVPASPEEKAEFFNWLREKGLFEAYATVNSQSLNKLYRESIEEAAEQGVADFKIPGIGEPNFSKTLSFRRGK